MAQPAKSYRDLLVWQKGMGIVLEVYRLTSRFPREEEYGLKAQMRRAAVSIPSNIAEGQARHQRKEFARFLRIAMGSVAELETQLELSTRLDLPSHDESEHALQGCGEIAKMAHGIIRSVLSH